MKYRQAAKLVEAAEGLRADAYTDEQHSRATLTIRRRDRRSFTRRLTRHRLGLPAGKRPRSPRKRRRWNTQDAWLDVPGYRETLR